MASAALKNAAAHSPSASSFVGSQSSPSKTKNPLGPSEAEAAAAEADVRLALLQLSRLKAIATRAAAMISELSQLAPKQRRRNAKTGTLRSCFLGGLCTEPDGWAL